MPDDPGKSSTISHRRELLEELLRERSKVVAGMPIYEQDPPSSSPLWRLGAHRVIGAPWRPVPRGDVVDLAVLALAWLERIDADAATARAEHPEA